MESNAFIMVWNCQWLVLSCCSVRMKFYPLNNSSPPLPKYLRLNYVEKRVTTLTIIFVLYLAFFYHYWKHNSILHRSKSYCLLDFLNILTEYSNGENLHLCLFIRDCLNFSHHFWSRSLLTVTSAGFLAGTGCCCFIFVVFCFKTLKIEEHRILVFTMSDEKAAGCLIGYTRMWQVTSPLLLLIFCLPC